MVMTLPSTSHDQRARYWNELGAVVPRLQSSGRSTPGTVKVPTCFTLVDVLNHIREQLIEDRVCAEVSSLSCPSLNTRNLTTHTPAVSLLPYYYIQKSLVLSIQSWRFFQTLHEHPLCDHRPYFAERLSKTGQFSPNLSLLALRLMVST
ncbi:hypothetical protein J6590_079516 [Homalodisca vitripennis]|nr:hypothetical protein J6590_079516 [Homalodisca vitripennis]